MVIRSFDVLSRQKEYPAIRAFVDAAIKDFDADYEIINDVPSFQNRGRILPVNLMKISTQSS